MREKKCIFCNRDSIKEDIIHETENFYVKVGLKLYSPGQVMIIPKEHYKCSAEYSIELTKEYRDLLKLVSKKISSLYGDTFHAEMGVWGQTVQHAHTHIVPLKGPEYKIKDILKEMVLYGSEKIDYEEVSIEKLKEIYRIEGKYIGLGQGDKEYLLHIGDRKFDIDNRHSQLTLRGFFTNKLGLKGVDGKKIISMKYHKIDEKRRELTKKLKF